MPEILHRDVTKTCIAWTNHQLVQDFSHCHQPPGAVTVADRTSSSLHRCPQAVHRIVITGSWWLPTKNSESFEKTSPLGSRSESTSHPPDCCHHGCESLWTTGYKPASWQNLWLATHIQWKSEESLHERNLRVSKRKHKFSLYLCCLMKSTSARFETPTHLSQSHRGQAKLSEGVQCASIACWAAEPEFPPQKNIQKNRMKLSCKRHLSPKVASAIGTRHRFLGCDA